jgi:hypothetical protein
MRRSRVLGYYMVITGAMCLALALDDILQQLEGLHLAIFATVASLAYAPLIISGMMLVRGAPHAQLSGAVAWIPTLLFVRAGHVQYSASALPMVEWKVWPTFGLRVELTPIFTAALYEERRPFYYGVNVVALLALTYLGERAWRRHIRFRRAAVRSRQLRRGIRMPEAT